MDRRKFFAAAVGAGVAVSQVRALGQPADKPAPKAESKAAPAKGRLKQSICRWCFGGMKLEDLCKAANEIGYQSVELLNPDEWPTVKAAGLTCAVANAVKSNPIHSGFNRVENHDKIVKELEERLPLVKAAGIPNQICFSGNRGGMSDSEGLKNCATGLKRVTKLAEQLGVVLIMELLNSRVDHGDYMCDRTEWGVNLVKEVGSPNFKLLYDIYHMQIMEGDVIRTITTHADHIGHYHTAGNPGRRDLDETQELNYVAISKAIADKGYKGFFGQEFMPKKDPVAALRHAFNVCTV